MAEPLTSSDVWRMERGWGVSPLASEEERKRFAAAGELPLSTTNRARFEEGRGISPMASKSEKEAWVASEVMAGRRDPMDLPKSYGGLGERPEATTRRQFRMQQEWDKQYEMLRKEQEAAIEAEKFQQQYQLEIDREARLQRDQDMEVKAKLAESAREDKVQNEASLMMDAMKGAVAPDGTVIANPIRPEDDDAIDRLNNLAGKFKYGIENRAASSMFEMLYRDALKFREAKMKESDQNELAAVNLSVRTGKPFEEFGTYDEFGMFQPNPQGIISASEEVKMAEEAKQEEKAIAREGRGEEARVRAREEGDKRTRRKQLDDDILTEEQTLIDFQNQRQSPSRDAEIKKSRAKLLNLSIKRAAVDDLVFKDQNAYKKALEEGRKIPSGTTIYIGTIPVKVK